MPEGGGKHDMDPKVSGPDDADFVAAPEEEVVEQEARFEDEPTDVADSIENEEERAVRQQSLEELKAAYLGYRINQDGKELSFAGAIDRIESLAEKISGFTAEEQSEQENYSDVDGDESTLVYSAIDSKLNDIFVFSSENDSSRELKSSIEQKFDSVLDKIKKLFSSDDTIDEQKMEEQINNILKNFFNFLDKLYNKLTAEGDEEDAASSFREDLATLDEDDYFDDEQEEIKDASHLRLVSTATDDTDENNDDDAAAAATMLLLNNDEAEGSFGAVTKDPEIGERWKKMIVSGFMNGSLIRESDGSYKMEVRNPVIPWIADKPEEFFRKNYERHAGDPEYFSTRRNPARDGEFFPREVFLDETGTALDLYINGRFDEFASTEAGKNFYAEEQSPFEIAA